MRYQLALIFNSTLRAFGFKTISSQFTLSYFVIFVLMITSVGSYFVLIEDRHATLDLAGHQGMLSQKMAKEAFLVSQNIENISSLNKSIGIFESTHRALLSGDKQLGVVPPINKEVKDQLSRVGKLWSSYKVTIKSYAESPSKELLQKVKSENSAILKQLNSAVGLMVSDTSRAAQFQRSLVVFLGICIITVVLISRLVGMYWLMDQIRLLRDRLVEVSKNDFSHRIDAEVSDNEVGDMFAAFNTMLTEVGNVVSGVKNLAIGVQKDVVSVDGAASISEASVLKQNRELDAVATAVNEMSATVHEVAENATETAAAASLANEKAQEGHKVVEFSYQYISQMSDQLTGAAGVMQQLDADSQEIGQVLSVITGIAEQTNLLALNAAIEAARAGEQGRGFAVVADEVRTLASKTQESTEEIRKIIERLQSQSTKAVDVMESSSEQARESAEQTRKANQSLVEIVDAVSRILDMSTLIATASEEQAAVVNEVDRNITNIAHEAQESSQAVSGLKATSAQMVVNSKELNALADRFSV
ncbi:MAG: methyl-accepting chemotaxis protein [Flavobacteriales bacterium]|jgi:methyl-accepting chemotaxis protein